MLQAKKVLVAASGGLDSTVLLAEAKNVGMHVEAVHFNYGQKHQEMEYASLCAICSYLNIQMHYFVLPFSAWGFKSALLQNDAREIPEGHYEAESMKSTVVPFRNGIMLSILAGLAESMEMDSIGIAAHAGDHAIYPDCRSSFLRTIASAIQQGTERGINIYSPFMLLPKCAIVALGAVLGAPMHLSYSCYKGGVLHCGLCGTCTERQEAFDLVDVEDKTVYEEIVL